MKKLYNKKGKVHPSPPSTTDPLHLLLPTAILALAVALSAEDQEVIAYLISCTNNNHKSTPKKFNSSGGAAELGVGGSGGSGSGSHPPTFQCDCFRCYTSFWARWDASPNRQVIHDVIEAYEEKLEAEKRRRSSAKVKKDRKKNNSINNKLEVGPPQAVKVEVEAVDVGGDSVEVSGRGGGGDDGGEDCEVVVGVEKVGTMRRLVGFIGDGIWGVWNKV